MMTFFGKSPSEWILIGEYDRPSRSLVTGHRAVLAQLDHKRTSQIHDIQATEANLQKVFSGDSIRRIGERFGSVATYVTALNDFRERDNERMRDLDFRVKERIQVNADLDRLEGKVEKLEAMLREWLAARSAEPGRESNQKNSQKKLEEALENLYGLGMAPDPDLERIIAASRDLDSSEIRGDLNIPMEREASPGRGGNA